MGMSCLLTPSVIGWSRVPEPPARTMPLMAGEHTTLAPPVFGGDPRERSWQSRRGRGTEPEVLYCGVAPAALFESRDAGATWSLVRRLHDHPHRSRWPPGFGGLCLH